MVTILAIGLGLLSCDEQKKAHRKLRRKTPPKHREAPILTGVLRMANEGLVFMPCGGLSDEWDIIAHEEGGLEEMVKHVLPCDFPEWGALVRFRSDQEGDTLIVKELLDADMLHPHNNCLEFEVWAVRYGNDQWQLRISPQEGYILLHAPGRGLAMMCEYNYPVKHNGETIYRIKHKGSPVVIRLKEDGPCDDKDPEVSSHYDGHVLVQYAGHTLRGCLVRPLK